MYFSIRCLLLGHDDRCDSSARKTFVAVRSLRPRDAGLDARTELFAHGEPSANALPRRATHFVATPNRTPGRGLALFAKLPLATFESARNKSHKQTEVKRWEFRFLSSSLASASHCRWESSPACWNLAPR